MKTHLEFPDPQTHEIIGGRMEVHSELGCGFHEPVYHHALAIELRRRGVPFVREPQFTIAYKGEELPLLYRVDFLCYGEVLVEIKALGAIGPKEEAQVINYLKASKRQRAVLLNFGTTSLQHKRLVLNFANDPLRRIDHARH